MKGSRAKAPAVHRTAERLPRRGARLCNWLARRGPLRPSIACALRLACVAPLALGSALLVAPGAVAEAPSSRRLALLVGDGTYTASDLPPTPASRDARLLASALGARGFAVDLRIDLTRQAMQGAMDDFLAKVTPGSIVLVYLNGIGIKIASRTYLLPVDAAVWNEDDVRREGVNVDGLLGELDRRGARIKVAILDMARPNPFERNFRDHAAGLGPLSMPAGTLALHAVARNKVGSDAGPEASLFMKQLVKAVAASDLGAEEALTRVRDEVSAATMGVQVPWLESTATEPFAFDRNRPDPSPSASTAPAEPPEQRRAPPHSEPRIDLAMPAADPCAASVAERDGLVTLALEDKSRAGQQARFTLDGMTYGSHFDAGGTLRAEAPLLHATGDLAWDGVAGAACARRGLAFSNYRGTFMLALVWDTYVSLALHVVEPPDGRIGGPSQYLNPDRPNLDGSSAFGVLRVFGEAMPGTTQVQVYILPPGRNPRHGEIYAFIEFASRGTPARRPFCGDNPKATVSFKLLHLDDGHLDSRNGRFGSLECGTVWAGDPESSGYFQRWKWRL